MDDSGIGMGSGHWSARCSALTRRRRRRHLRSRDVDKRSERPRSPCPCRGSRAASLSAFGQGIPGPRSSSDRHTFSGATVSAGHMLDTRAGRLQGGRGDRGDRRAALGRCNAKVRACREACPETASALWGLDISARTHDGQHHGQTRRGLDDVKHVATQLAQLVPLGSRPSGRSPPTGDRRPKLADGDPSRVRRRRRISRPHTCAHPATHSSQEQRHWRPYGRRVAEAGGERAPLRPGLSLAGGQCSVRCGGGKWVMRRRLTCDDVSSAGGLGVSISASGDRSNSGHERW